MKRPVRVPWIALACIVAGCAGVGVPATSDPWKQYQYGCALMSAGRVTRAEPLLTQSLAHYEKSDEHLKLALVQAQYALLIETPAFVVNRVFAKQRAQMGGREGLPREARTLNERAKANLLRVLATPQVPSPDRTQALLVLNQVEERLEQRREACATIERAAASYREAEGIQYEYAIYGQPSVAAYLQGRREVLECAGPS